MSRQEKVAEMETEPGGPALAYSVAPVAWRRHSRGQGGPGVKVMHGSQSYHGLRGASSQGGRLGASSCTFNCGLGL